MGNYQLNEKLFDIAQFKNDWFSHRMHDINMQIEMWLIIEVTGVFYDFDYVINYTAINGCYFIGNRI